MALSYTDMARRYTPRRNIGLAGEIDLSSAESAEAWIQSLPPPIRQNFETNLKSVALSLPAPAQIELERNIRARGHASPIALPLDGLGCACEARMANDGTAGLGQDWGALLTGLVKAGSDIYSAKVSGDVQKSLASKDNATNVAIATAQANAAVAAQKLMADAQAQAAALSAQTKIAQAPALKTAIMWGGIALALIAGGSAIYVIRKSRKK